MSTGIKIRKVISNHEKTFTIFITNLYINISKFDLDVDTAKYLIHGVRAANLHELPPEVANDRFSY
jgi:hypothetical protein